MEDRFEFCFKFTLGWEGADGAVEHDPNDPGGTTRWGIDQRDHPNFNVATLTREQAARIYYNENWIRARCAALNPPWDLLVFDGSVNPGFGFIIPAVQECVGGLKVDGHIGIKTIAAVNAAVREAIECVYRKRLAYYEARPQRLKKHFLEGWENRTRALETLVLSS